MTGVLRVLLAEPDPITREGVKLALETDGLAVCGEPFNSAAAIKTAILELPDICLVDESLPGGSLVAVDAIYQRVPTTRLIMLTESEEPASLLAAIRAGACGFVRKDLDPTRLTATLRGVMAGEAALSRRLTFRLLESLRARSRARSAPTTPGGPSMTDRELEVLELMAEGLRTSEIAASLSIAEVTVRRHVASAVGKLGVADRAAAVAVLTGRSRV